MTDRFGAVGAEDVEVRAGMSEPQTAMLVEGRFPNGEDVAELFEGGDVGGFVSGVGDGRYCQMVWTQDVQGGVPPIVSV